MYVNKCVECLYLKLILVRCVLLLQLLELKVHEKQVELLFSLPGTECIKFPIQVKPNDSCEQVAFLGLLLGAQTSRHMAFDINTSFEHL